MSVRFWLFVAGLISSGASGFFRKIVFRGEEIDEGSG
jgi:hypothetical protein